MQNTPDDEISAALAGIRSRLDTLASINAANILIPGEPKERYHAIIEESYVALGLVETEIDVLRNAGSRKTLLFVEFRFVFSSP